jgi:peptidoglycan/LPS O-acetylase OafA/YrhL
LVATAAAVLLISCLWIITPTSGFPGVIAWLPVSATAMLLWLGKASVQFGGLRFLSKQPLRYIGDISYSLYLWHYLLLMLPRQLNQGSIPLGLVLFGITGTFICAAASYHWLENPIRRSPALQRDGWATLLVLAICLALSLDSTVLVESLFLNR